MGTWSYILELLGTLPYVFLCTFYLHHKILSDGHLLFFFNHCQISPLYWLLLSREGRVGPWGSTHDILVEYIVGMVTTSSLYIQG